MAAVLLRSPVPTSVLLLGVLVTAAALESCSPELCEGGGTPRCPAPTGAVSHKRSLSAEATENIYFRNAAPFTCEILRVGDDGMETSHGLLPSGLRRALVTQHGDVWIARAVRPGTAADRRLLLEHRVGSVPIRDCECPQPRYVDCSKPPTKRDDFVISDRVMFENLTPEPINVFYWNGTCEELVSWDEIGGVQPTRRKPLLSTQGHSFRFRSVATDRLVMAHTLNDVVVRGCDDDEDAPRRAPSLDGLEALRAETRHFESEADRLSERLAAKLHALAAAFGASNATASGASRAEEATAWRVPVDAAAAPLLGSWAAVAK